MDESPRPMVDGQMPDEMSPVPSNSNRAQTPVLEQTPAQQSSSTLVPPSVEVRKQVYDEAEKQNRDINFTNLCSSTSKANVNNAQTATQLNTDAHNTKPLKTKYRVRAATYPIDSSAGVQRKTQKRYDPGISRCKPLSNLASELAKVEAAANHIGRLLGITETPQTFSEYRKDLNQRLSSSNEESRTLIYRERYALAEATVKLSKEENVERRNIGFGIIEGKLIVLKSLAEAEGNKANLLNIIGRTVLAITLGMAVCGLAAVGVFAAGVLVIPGLSVFAAGGAIFILAAAVGFLGVGVASGLLAQADWRRVDWCLMKDLEHQLAELLRLFAQSSNAQAN